ncbi:MAG: zf-HC2 domain-containing protein [Burkholderiaceae bacterium]|nr:zf-HC2 domain-containing protein [Burkholderiaceae bacterium]
MKLMRNCREVAHLVLESQDRPLRPIETVSLRLHWLICDGCRRFRDQQALMRVALQRWRGYREGGEGD